MGFFDGLLRGLGFEGPDKPKEQKQETKDVSVYENKGAEYDLTKQTKEVKPVNFVPNSEKEVQSIVDVLKSGKDVIVDLKNFDTKEYIRALDFMSGAVYALGGKIKKMSEKTYFFCLVAD